MSCVVAPVRIQVPAAGLHVVMSLSAAGLLSVVWSAAAMLQPVSTHGGLGAGMQDSADFAASISSMLI